MKDEGDREEVLMRREEAQDVGRRAIRRQRGGCKLTILVDSEGYASLIDRIITKAGVDKHDAESVRRGKDGAGLVYEFDGARWSLEDGECGECGAARLPPVRFGSVRFGA